MPPDLARIESADDPRLAAFRMSERALTPRSARRGRRRELTPAGLFVAEGDLVVRRALEAGCEPVAFLTGEPVSARLSEAGAQLLVADESVRKAATGLGVALDVVGLFRRSPLPPWHEVASEARRIVVLDAVDNPTNVGAVVRSAVALGADALLLDATSADPLARRALRVSMGTAFSLPTARHGGPAQDLVVALGGLGVTTVALTPGPGSTDIAAVSARLRPHERVALLLGSERSGLDDATMQACAHRACIPMHAGVDSLNVAAAAAVAAYALFSDAGRGAVGASRDWPGGPASGQHRQP